MTRLPPVRMLCPSLGTQLLMPDPRALQSYILYLTTPGTPRMNVPIVSRLGLAFAILMTFIIPPIYARLGSDHDKWPMFKPIWPDNTYFLAISKIPYQGDFDLKMAILRLKRGSFFRN
jgi:hypothetical protein